MTEQTKKLLFFAVVAFVLWQAMQGGGVVGAKPPFKAEKLSVLVVEETAARGSYTSGQRAAIMGTAPGSLIATVKARDGEFRILDKDQSDLSNSSPWVKEAFAVPHPELPWIVAAGPKSGVSQKLPENIADTLKLIEGVK